MPRKNLAFIFKYGLSESGALREKYVEGDVTIYCIFLTFLYFNCAWEKTVQILLLTKITLLRFDWKYCFGFR